MALGAVFLIVGLLASLIKDPDPKAPPYAMLVIGLLVAVAGAGVLTFGLVRLLPNLGASWSLHERGIRFVKSGSARSLRYEEIGELTVKAVRLFVDGVCTGDVRAVTFRSDAPGRPAIFVKQVRRPASLSGADLNSPSELESVCDRVSAQIADRMAKLLKRGETIDWGPKVRIHSDGLEIDSPRSGMIKIGWRQIGRQTVTNAVYRLSRSGDQKPALEMPTYVPNFFPGHLIVLRQIEKSGGSGT